MSRLRQYFASRYGSQEATSAEFENIIRYLNSAEFGNLTLSELLDKLFDENGDVSLDFGFRYDPSTGLEFQQDTGGEWQLLIPSSDLRGQAGVNMGVIEGPLFSNTQHFTATASQTSFSYITTTSASDVLVWVNGVLQAPTLYAYTPATSTLVFASGQTEGALVTVSTIRANPSTSFLRVETTAVDGQVSFPFPFEDGDEVVVFRNGILQREGGGYDYIKSIPTSTIIMTAGQSAGSLLTIIRISNNNLDEVAGLMLEDAYCTNGLIQLDRVSIADGALAQAKVAGLVAALDATPTVNVGTTTPTTAAPGDLWVNTSGSVPYLLFYDGLRWMTSSPNGMIPLPQTANASQYVRLNATATALEYATIDLSTVVPVSSRGAVNGVASLDSSGLLPASQIPSWVSRFIVTGLRSGSVVNGTFTIGLLTSKVTIDSISIALAAGTATVQLSVGGTLLGGTVAASTTPQKLAIASGNVDASTSVQVISLVITGASGATDLAYSVGCLVVG